VINRTHSELLCHAGSSGWETIPGGQVEGLVGAERHDLGLGLVELLPAAAGAQLVQAVLSRLWLRPGGLVAAPGLAAQLEAGW
jgi:hypothetical protein